MAKQRQMDVLEQEVAMAMQQQVDMLEQEVAVMVQWLHQWLHPDKPNVVREKVHSESHTVLPASPTGAT